MKSRVVSMVLVGMLTFGGCATEYTKDDVYPLSGAELKAGHTCHRIKEDRLHREADRNKRVCFLPPAPPMPMVYCVNCR
jgi:hypothetical protein